MNRVSPGPGASWTETAAATSLGIIASWRQPMLCLGCWWRGDRRNLVGTLVSMIQRQPWHESGSSSLGRRLLAVLLLLLRLIVAGYCGLSPDQSIIMIHRIRFSFFTIRGWPPVMYNVVWTRTEPRPPTTMGEMAERLAEWGRTVCRMIVLGKRIW
jgi:hypothetical protein